MDKNLTELPWLERLNGFASPRQIRDSIFDRHPQLAPGRLKRLAILGGGNEGRRLAEICASQGIEVAEVYDNNAGLRGRKIGPCRIKPSDAIVTLDRTVPVVVASHRVLGAVEMLRGMDICALPFSLLQIADPETFPPHLFHKDMLEDTLENRNRYEELALLLADSESRRVLNGVLGYRLTGDPTALHGIIDWDLYGSSGLFDLGHDEVYVDAGSFDGDSIRMFIDHADGQFERVLAFEPDPVTYPRLKENFKDDPRIETFNAGLHRKNGVLRFDDDGSRGAIFTETGSAQVSVLGLDEVLAGDRVSFIKMNIEGSELDALQGGQESIRNHAPKLAISTYHRSSDLWKIPQLVKSLVPEHRMVLRQHDGGFVETVLYACPE